MNTKQILQNIKNLVIITSVLFLGLSVAQAGASGKNTAAHMKANIADLEGKRVTLDVAFVRAIQEKNESPNIDLFVAVTRDDKERAGGGAMLVVSDADDHDNIVRKYGTNLDRQGKKQGPDLNSMRGTLRKFDEGKGRPVIYLDLTDDGFEATPENMATLKIGAKHALGKGKKKFR